MAFKAEFKLDDKEIIWRLDENALKKVPKLNAMRKNDTFVNTAVKDSPKKSLENKDGIYELILTYTLKTTDIADITLLSAADDVKKAQLAEEAKIKTTKTEAVSLIKDYMLCIAGKKISDKIQEKQIIFGYDKKMFASKRNEFSYTFSLIYYLGGKR